MVALHYTIDTTSAVHRKLLVTVDLDRTALASREARELVMFLPTWTPGSYLIREYSRHLGPITAIDADNGRQLTCRKTSKNRFAIDVAHAGPRVRLRYEVHAHELTVRTAHVDAGHAFWNHACVTLWPLGATETPARLRIRYPAEWSIACPLPPADGEHGADEPGAATRERDFTAAGLAELVDAPCLVGTFATSSFSVDEVPHTVVLDGLAAVSAPANLLDDLAAIVRTAQAVVGGPLPYRAYLFLALFTDDGHGGLEHADSSTLLASRTALRTPRGYREFLALAAHELFHAWNVKRMRPAEFWSYDYEHETYTPFLWLAEGFTAYYDDLIVRRAGAMSHRDYLACIAKNVQAMWNAPGRLVMSLADSSFDAWIRLYRPDANTRNSSQNYYGNGAVAALCLDLAIRGATAGARSLDDVVRALYSRSYGAGRGYTRADVDAVVHEIAGEKVVSLLASLVDGPLDPALDEALAVVGLRASLRDADRPQLGVAFAAGGTRVASVTAGTPAHHAGVCPGDEILAVQDLRVDAANWQEVFGAVAELGKPLSILIARRGVVQTLTATIDAGRGQLSIEPDPAATPQQLAMRSAWMGASPEDSDAAGQLANPAGPN